MRLQIWKPLNELKRLRNRKSDMSEVQYCIESNNGNATQDSNTDQRIQKASVVIEAFSQQNKTVGKMYI
jgi:hypothetical protein